MHCAHVYNILLFSYRKFSTNSNKSIQFGIFALWKTTKYHIYWKDSQDIDGLENEHNYQSAHEMDANTNMTTQYIILILIL